MLWYYSRKKNARQSISKFILVSGTKFPWCVACIHNWILKKVFIICQFLLEIFLYMCKHYWLQYLDFFHISFGRMAGSSISLQRSAFGYFCCFRVVCYIVLMVVFWHGAFISCFVCHTYLSHGMIQGSCSSICSFICQHLKPP